MERKELVKGRLERYIAALSYCADYRIIFNVCFITSKSIGPLGWESGHRPVVVRRKRLVRVRLGHRSIDGANRNYDVKRV